MNLRAELRYLRYVLCHKFYVLRAGLAIAKHTKHLPTSRWRWIVRLLVHDWSKFRRDEWVAYTEYFYGDVPVAAHGDERLVPGALTLPEVARLTRDRQAAFNRAWLVHIHRNPHHWQHWILREDSGKEIVLVPPAIVVFEMVADWLAAGPKALTAHTMADGVAETIVWYAGHHRTMQMRQLVRETAESILSELADAYGVRQAAQEMASARRARESIVIPR